jgi:tetratricopeptide (TPR) repeat protein
LFGCCEGKVFTVDYYSLDLRITKEPEGFLNLYKASILENGDIKATRTFELRRDLKLIKMLEDLEEKAVIPFPQPKETVHIEFGKMLYDTVFSGELGDYFNKRFSEAQEENCGLRVSMQLNDDVPEIATLPWEYLHNGEEFLAVKVGILLSRLPAGVTKVKSKPINSILRMLVIISSPDDTRVSPINTEKEQEIILEAVNKLQIEQRIKVDFAEDATLENIQGYLNEQDYHIVHLTGHGISIEGKGHIVLETKDRKAKLIDNRTLSNLFSGKEIRLVVLSSCESAKGSNKEAYSDIASMLLKQGIPAVVAMQYSVLDDVAIEFAFNFYKAITNEDSVDLALKKARVKMKKSGKSNGLDFATPVLYLSDCNCVQVEEIKPEPAEFDNKQMMLHDLQIMKKGFVARNKELRNLERDFSSDVMRVAILHGLGGMGKTVLATRLALRMNEYFNGIFGMKYTSITRPEDILVKVNNFLIKKGRNELNQILDQQVTLEEKTSLLVDILNQKRFLIIFDNFEDCLNEDRNDIENPELKAFIQYILKNTTRNTKFLIITRYDFDPLESRLVSGIKHISLPELHFPQINWLMNNFTELADLGIRKKMEIYDVIGGHPWMIGQFAKHAAVQGVDDLLLDLRPLKKELIEFTLLDKSFSKLNEDARKLLLCASVYEEAVPVEALSWIVGDTSDESPSVGQSLNKLLQWGLISKEQQYDKNIYSEHTIVKDFAREKLEGNILDKKKLIIRAASYYQNISSQTASLWDHLRARDYYFKAGDWESANQIVEGTVNNLIRWGYIELAMNLLNDSITTTSGGTKTNAEYILATIYYSRGDLTTASKIFNNLLYKYEEMEDNNGVAVLLHAIGVIYLDQGNCEEAVKSYSQALNIAAELGDLRLIECSLGQLGNVHYLQGNYEEAAKNYNQSLSIAKELADKSGIAGALHALGNIHYLQSNYEEAAKKYTQSLKIREELGDKNGIAQTLHQLGMIYDDQGNYEEAVKLYNQSLRIEEELGDKSGIANLLHQLGNIHYFQGNYKEAIQNYNQSLKIHKELRSKSGIASTLYQLGMIHQDQGNYEEAVKLYNQSLEMKKELGDKRGIANLLHQLGMIHQKQGNYEEAVKKYTQSLKIGEELENKGGIASSLFQLGTIHQDQGNYEEAVKKYTQSLKIGEELEDKSKVSTALHALGNIHYLQSNYEEAVKKYTQSLKIEEELVNKSGIADSLHQLGMIHQDQGNYEEAVELYNHSHKMFEDLGAKSKIATTLHALGNIHYLQGNYEEAVKKYTQSLKIGEELGNKSGIADSLHQLGMIHQNQGNYEEAVSLYSQSFKMFEELGNKSAIAITLHQLGNVHYDQGNYEEAVNLYNQSLKIEEELGNKSGIADSLHQLGMIHQDQGNYEEALEKYNQSLKIKEELGDKRGIAITLHQLGNVHYDQGNYEEAVKKYTQSLKIKEELGNENGIAGTLHQLGMIHQNQGNYEEAVKLYNQSLKMFEELGNKIGIASTLHQLGMIHQNQGNYEEAVKNYNQSLKIEEELGYKSGIAITLHQLGIIHQDQGNYEEAVNLYNQALKIKEEMKDKRGIANSLGQLGIIHRHQGNYKEAVNLYNQAMRAFEEIGDKSGIAITLGQMGRIYEEKGEYPLALQASYTAFSIFKSLNSPYTQLAAKDLAKLRDKMGAEEFDTEFEKLVNE